MYASRTCCICVQAPQSEEKRDIARVCHFQNDSQNKLHSGSNCESMPHTHTHTYIDLCMGVTVRAFTYIIHS